jgi:hypothetical protein
MHIKGIAHGLSGDGNRGNIRSGLNGSFGDTTCVWSWLPDGGTGVAADAPSTHSARAAMVNWLFS